MLSIFSCLSPDLRHVSFCHYGLVIPWPVWDVIVIWFRCPPSRLKNFQWLGCHRYLSKSMAMVRKFLPSGEYDLLTVKWYSPPSQNHRWGVLLIYVLHRKFFHGWIFSTFQISFLGSISWSISDKPLVRVKTNCLVGEIFWTCFTTSKKNSISFKVIANLELELSSLLNPISNKLFPHNPSWING